MKVAAFAQLRRTLTPTGVGVHIIEMCRGLHAHPDIDLKLLVSKKELDATGSINKQFPIHDLPAVTYPLSRVWMERVWRVTKGPKADKYCGDVDWVYSPAETYVPLRRAKSVVTIHDMYPMETNLPWSNSAEHIAKRKRWQSLMKRILPEANLLLAVSEFTKQRIVDMTGFDANRIVVTGNGVSQAYYDAGEGKLQAEQLPLQGKYILVVGGLTKRKRGDSVLDVAAELHKRNAGVTVAVAGKCRDRFIQMARQLPNVTLLGYVDDLLLPALLSHAQALLFLSQYEGFGMPAAEAMAAGTPVIASNQTALPEIVENAGISLVPEDITAVTDAVQLVVSDATTRNDLIAKGRERAKRFTWQVCVDRLVDALKAHA